MSIISVSDITLYTFADDKGGDSYHLATWLANNSIEYTNMYYDDITQKQINLDALNTWIDPNDDEPDLTDGPFIIYKEVSEETIVDVVLDSSNKPVYTMDSNGVPQFQYSSTQVTKERFRTIRNMEQLEQSNLLEYYLLTGN